MHSTKEDIYEDAILTHGWSLLAAGPLRAVDLALEQRMNELEEEAPIEDTRFKISYQYQP